MSSAGPGFEYGVGESITWSEWEDLIESRDSSNSANQIESDQIEEDYDSYRIQVNKETPNLTLDDDIKSEV